MEKSRNDHRVAVMLENIETRQELPSSLNARKDGRKRGTPTSAAISR
jgi:hypothetical protein